MFIDRFILIVTGVTGIPNERGGMAVAAGVGAFVILRKGVRAIISSRLPGSAVMTASAVSPKQPGVVSRILMARSAGSGRAAETAAVAALAGQPGMRAGQWELRSGMVEGDVTPAVGGMAGGAVRAILPIMTVVLRMAGGTICRSAFVLRIFMTVCAGDLFVFTG